MTAPWCPRCGDHHDELPLRNLSPSLLLWLGSVVAIVGVLVWVAT